LQQERVEYLKIAGSFLGVNLDKEVEKKKIVDEGMFQDPQSYENMTEDEKKEVTNRMLNKHKGWAKTVGLGE
jgi:hypothetical protein